MKKPNFFLVGAPKSGTTSMCSYLQQHPDIFISDLKEPFFFGRDLKHRIPYWFVRDEKRYLELFEKADGAQRVGEGTVWYLRSVQAAREIKAFVPDAQIIIMLRNPIDMMYSWHSQMLWSDFEDIKDFEKALEAEEERKRGLEIPERACVAEGLFYRDMARYSEQVERYFHVFGREKVQVIIFDDFKKDTSAVFRSTLRFLEVDDSFQTEFAVVNDNKRARSKSMLRFLRQPPSFVSKIGRAMMPTEWRSRLFQSLWKFNRQHQSRAPLHPELRKELQCEFRPEVEKLSFLLDRDLTHWCED